MKTAEEVFLSVLEKELDFVPVDKLKSAAKALVDRLGMWDVKFMDMTNISKECVMSPVSEFLTSHCRYDMD